MCYNCGCQLPEDDMGSKDNVTNESFQALAKKWNKSFAETRLLVKRLLEKDDVTDPHLIDLFERASRAWGQSIPEAKKYTLQLLKDELRTSLKIIE